MIKAEADVNSIAFVKNLRNEKDFKKACLFSNQHFFEMGASSESRNKSLMVHVV